MREVEEHNRELLILAYRASPSHDLLREITNAFDPICRAQAHSWARSFRDTPLNRLDDLVQDARILVLLLLPKYTPRDGSFQRFLIRSLRRSFANKWAKQKRENERFKDCGA